MRRFLISFSNYLQSTTLKTNLQHTLNAIFNHRVKRIIHSSVSTEE